jgi:RND family efflux transporter MFP subunit
LRFFATAGFRTAPNQANEDLVMRAPVRHAISGWVWGAALLAAAAPAIAQRSEGDSAAPSVTATDSPAGAADRVAIVRQPLTLVDPQAYQVSLQLEAIRSVDLAAPVDGIVRTVHIEPGKSISDQAEAVRLDTTEQQLLFERAKALYRASQVEFKRARSSGDSDSAELADARMQAAKADLDLAQYRLDRMSVRAPFAGQVLRVGATPGQVVRAGERLATVADASKLKVEVPIDRKDALPEAAIDLAIEDVAVRAHVEHVLPLDSRFEPLRNLIHSVASAVAIIDNAGDRFKIGQTVHVPIIPRHPITEIPTSCLGNTGNGDRKIQVIRRNVVRDVAVQLLGQVGPERVYVSGPLEAGDEVIVSTSRALADGTQVKQAIAPAGRTTDSRDKSARPPRSSPGF